MSPSPALDAITRTHPPNLPELSAVVDGLRELTWARIDAVERLADERDRLYGERSDAQQKVLETTIAALRDTTQQAFEAADRAIEKAELAQKEYNARSNEFRQALDDAIGRMLLRTEAERQFERLTKDIDEAKRERASLGSRKDVDELRARLDALQGVGVGVKESKAATYAVVGVIALIVSTLIAIVGVLLKAKP